MNTALCARSQALSGPVGIGVTEQQHELKKQHAGGPHAGRAAEMRQNCFGNDRLDQKQQQRAEEYGRDPDELHELNRIIRYLLVAGVLAFNSRNFSSACLDFSSFPSWL